MQLKKITCEFENEDLADLVSGRIRRSIRGIRRIAVTRGRHAAPPEGSERFTLLPANLRMMNYQTAVMVSSLSNAGIPEPMLRTSVTMTVICSTEYAGAVSSQLQSAGAMHIRVR